MRLVDERKVTLHLSEMVVREHAAQREDQIRTILQDILDKAKAANRPSLPTELCEFATTILAEGAELMSGVITSSGRSFNEWTQRYCSDVVLINDNHRRRVIDNYFAGKGGFERPRNRDDFPDAFIFQAICDLAASQPLCVVSNDKNLGYACSSVQGVTLFKTLEEFLGSEYCVPFLGDVHATENLVAVHKIGREQLRTPLDWLTRELRKWIVDQPLTLRFGYPPVLPKAVNDVSEQMLHCAEAQYIGNGTVIIPFEAHVRVKAEMELGSSIIHGRTLTSKIEGYPIVCVEGGISCQMPSDFLKPAPPEAVAGMFDRATFEFTPSVGPIWGI